MGTKNPSLFYGAIVVAVIAIALAIYYVIPNMTHVLASGTGAHYKHAALFSAVAVICIIGALINRPKSAKA